MFSRCWDFLHLSSFFLHSGMIVKERKRDDLIKRQKQKMSSLLHYRIKTRFVLVHIDSNLKVYKSWTSNVAEEKNWIGNFGLIVRLKIHYNNDYLDDLIFYNDDYDTDLLWIPCCLRFIRILIFYYYSYKVWTFFFPAASSKSLN